MDADIHSPLSIVLLSNHCVKIVHAHVLKRIKIGITGSSVPHADVLDINQCRSVFIAKQSSQNALPLVRTAQKNEQEQLIA